MLKKYLLLLLLISQFNFAQNVQLSVYSEISLITSGPGDHLYEKFGHTAIRVRDPLLKLDLLYNYGIFDFNDPDFYANFIKGFMKYKLARYPFQYAIKSAQQDQRWVKQQVLSLNQEEKNHFFYLLEKNAQPENASYFYDPFFDNCATRPRDIIKSVLKENLILKDNFITNPKSLRTLMNEKIHQNSWGSFGINIALGSRLDKIASTEEYLYLPEYLFLAYENSKIKNDNDKEVNLVRKTSTLLAFEPKKAVAGFINPLLVFSVLLVLVGYITYRDYKNNTRTKILDFVLFFSTGLTGVLIAFLWFFTNHSTAPNNFNFLWAFAPNTIIAFLLLNKKQRIWINKYILFLLVLLILILIVHITGVQKFTYPLIPLIVLLFCRYLFLYKRFQNNN